MSLAQFVSLLDGLAFASILALFLFQTVVTWDKREISFNQFGTSIMIILVALVGGGNVGGGLFLSVIMKEGTILWYLIGLNGLFLSVIVVILISRWLTR